MQSLHNFYSSVSYSMSYFTIDPEASIDRVWRYRFSVKTSTCGLRSGEKLNLFAVNIGPKLG